MDKIWRKIIIDLGISKDENLEFICERRSNGLLFFNTEKKHYIRFWKKEDLKKEFEKHKIFLEKDFRVASVISFHEKDDYFIYVEEKLWDEVIWKEIYNKNITYNEWFDKIYSLSEWYFIAQKNTLNTIWNLDEIIKSNQLDKFYSECSRGKFLEINLVDKLYEKIYKEFNNCNYFVLTHWDFNSMNLFQTWFIDVEDAYNWPFWYDLVTLLTHNYWFPVDWSWRKIAYSFDISDIKKTISLHNNIYWIDIKETFNLSFILRWIWACVWMEEYPEEQQFRFKRIHKYIEKYLDWADLYDVFLDDVEKINKQLKK